MPRTLNPVWNESVTFEVPDPNTMEYEEMEIEVLNDKKLSNGSKKNHFLGRVKIYGSQFARRGEEGLVYFELEKKSVFSWIRGELGLRIYYYDEVEGDGEEKEAEKEVEKAAEKEEVSAVAEVPGVVEFPPVVTIMESLPPEVVVGEAKHHHYYSQEAVHSEPPPPSPAAMANYLPPEVRKMQMGQNIGLDKPRLYKRPNQTGDYSPRIIPGKFPGEPERIPSHGLVEPMQYLFIKIVKARGLTSNEGPFVEIRTSNHLFDQSPPWLEPLMWPSGTKCLLWLITS